MEDLIPWLVFGVPLLIAAGLLAWFLGRPIWQARQLEARAAAGDPQARAATERMQRAEAVMKRLLAGEDPERRRLLAMGRPARAVITGVQPLGIEVGSDPAHAHLFDVTLAIDGEGGAPRNVTICEVVSVLQVARLARGANVMVRVDPANPSNVILVWDTP